MAQNRFATLDGLRGVAALIVCVGHALPLRGRWLGSFHLAVDLFFLLSGFVLAAAYQRRLGGGLTVRGFMLSRVIRLYPMYLAGTIVGLGYALISNHFGAFHYDDQGLVPWFSLAVLFLPAPGRAMDVLFPLDGPAWSLFFELLINVGFAAVLWRLAFKGMVIVVVISAACLVVVGFWSSTLSGGSTWDTFADGLVRVSFSFPLGVLLYRLYLSGRLDWMPRLPPIGILAALPLLIGAATLAAAWSELVVVVGAFPLLLVAACRSEPTEDWKRAAFYAAGDLSYPLYTIHYPALGLIAGASAMLGLNEAKMDVIAIAALLPFAWWCARYDLVVREWLSRKLLPARPPVPVLLPVT